MSDESFALTLELDEHYTFQVRFDEESFAPITVDEPPPLGDGHGPNAARLIAAAVGNCLSASLLFCLRKARVNVRGVRARVEGRLVRNSRGRLRIGSLAVNIDPDVAEEDRERMSRCLAVFEDYCIVTESVRSGIPVDVSVSGAPVAEPAGAEG